MSDDFGPFLEQFTLVSQANSRLVNSAIVASMLRRAAVVLASRPVLLPSAPALLAPLAIQCLAPQLRTRGLAKKAVKEKSSKGGKGKSDEDNEDEDGAGPAAGSAGEGPDLDKLAAQMERSLGILLKEYHGMQVGRASPGMLDSIQVRAAYHSTPGFSHPAARPASPANRTPAALPPWIRGSSVFAAARGRRILNGAQPRPCGLLFVRLRRAGPSWLLLGCAAGGARGYDWSARSGALVAIIGLRMPESSWPALPHSLRPQPHLYPSLPAAPITGMPPRVGPFGVGPIKKRQ